MKEVDEGVLGWWRHGRRSGGTGEGGIIEGDGPVGGGSRTERMEEGSVEERMASGGGR